jgi:hypothetical protein
MSAKPDDAEIINLNDYVEVTLTEYGKELYRENFRKYVPDAVDPKISEPMRIQFWELMHIFGPVMYLGNTRMPFHDNRITVRKP